MCSFVNVHEHHPARYRLISTTMDWDYFKGLHAHSALFVTKKILRALTGQSTYGMFFRATNKKAQHFEYTNVINNTLKKVGHFQILHWKCVRESDSALIWCTHICLNLYDRRKKIKGKYLFTLSWIFVSQWWSWQYEQKSGCHKT